MIMKSFESSDLMIFKQSSQDAAMNFETTNSKFSLFYKEKKYPTKMVFSSNCFGVFYEFLLFMNKSVKFQNIFFFRMEEIKTLYKFRPDEIFRRITVTSLATLMIECSKLEYQQEDSARLTRFVTKIYI